MVGPVCQILQELEAGFLASRDVVAEKSFCASGVMELYLAHDLMVRDRSADMRTRRHGHETSHGFHGMRFKIPECFNYAGPRPI